MKVTPEDFLKETIEHYSADPDNRRCVVHGKCFYSPKTVNKHLSKGCAIGRHLKPAAQILFDNHDETSIKSIFRVGSLNKRMPVWMQHFDVNFLANVQTLHDISDNWESNGLSTLGKIKVNSIINAFDLKMDKYETNI